MSAPTSQRAVAADSIEELRNRLRGGVLAPSEGGYDTARRAWNGMLDKHPALIAQPANAADVAAAIAFGRREGLELGVKCGGHSALGQSIPEGGLMIDLSRRNEVRIDP
jgi:FAD/FMN-containing dehydrogenase